MTGSDRATAHRDKVLHDAAPETVTGLDGKTYPAHQPEPEATLDPAAGTSSAR